MEQNKAVIKHVETKKEEKKTFNQKNEFFTKPLGPGHYEPKVDLTKPRKQGTQWCASRTHRNYGLEATS